MKKEITIANKFFDELKTVAEWKFEDIQEDVEEAIERSSWEELEDDDVKEIVDNIIRDKLYKVFKDAIIAALTDKEKEDEQGINYAASEWSFLAYERGEKFSTEQDIYDSVKDDVEYSRYTSTND